MTDLNELTVRTAAALAAAGCVAADEEALELIAFTGGHHERLAAAIARRCEGEPVAWITGAVTFCGITIAVEPGVYVPRWQSEPLADRAVELLPQSGRAVDLGTGSGAIAVVLGARRPGATIVGTETDPVAAACARRNGVTVAVGTLFDGVPTMWRGEVDVVVGVLPYVPTSEIEFLPRDVVAFEPLAALDGGSAGTAVLERAIAESAQWLRPGGHLLLELGGDQPSLLEPVLEAAGFAAHRVIFDAEGDVRSIEAVAVLRHLSR